MESICIFKTSNTIEHKVGGGSKTSSWFWFFQTPTHDTSGNPLPSSLKNNKDLEGAKSVTKNPDGTYTAKYHQGGIVGDKTNRVVELVNKLFNVQPNEQVIKALKGELLVPQENIIKNFIPNMSALVNSLGTRNTSTVQQFYINKLEFPNATSTDEIVNAIKSLMLLVRQRSI